MAGVRTAWHVIDDGEFFCAECGGDRCYRRLAGRRRLTVLGLPVLPRGAAEPVVECSGCRRHLPPSVLEEPTTTRLAGLLRDAVHAVALGVLAAGGGDPNAARRAAVEAVRAAGFPECTEERLLTLQAALSRHRPPALDHELRETIGALTGHLRSPGRERLLLLGARVALADGPYRAAERALLRTVGEALRLPPTDTERLLTAAAAARA
ncbi:TerB family tellurite resistance protein [Streptomyces hoynatensis]|uniref:TerB family tellurite resistance protein n=1 Tax=Streptomyces hoynatensis TaxID=1141874 RepID=A0A3A9ZCA9_9ACTN|nr:TerB family tellurite resistance protein [Streptomyces hoynatensis]RKN45961.1 TerB family tellurite resistance protein [Streptomyces hoynatensis]